MPTPSTSLATLRPDLAGSFQAFDLDMNEQGYIGLRVLPVLNVGLQADTFGKVSIASLLAERDTKRASGSGYARQRYEFDADSYHCVEHGAEEPVDDRESKMYANYIQAEQLATKRARGVVMRNYEARCAGIIFNSVTFAPTAVTNEWDDPANATPIDDVEKRVQAIYDACGARANALVINLKVFRNLRNCAQIVDRIKYSGLQDPKSKSITEEVLAQVFDIEQVIVAGSKKNTAKEGQAGVLGDIWSGEYAWVGRVGKSEDIRETCVGRTFHWTEDGSQMGGTVESYRDETVRSDITRVRQDTHEKLLYDACGQLLSNITT